MRDCEAREAIPLVVRRRSKKWERKEGNVRREEWGRKEGNGTSGTREAGVVMREEGKKKRGESVA